MAMITIRNEHTRFEIPDGSRILHYLWDKTSFPQGCEDGTNPICACVILKGNENVNAKTHTEIETFAKANLPNSPRNRLACQIIIKKGEIEIEY